MIKTKRNIKKYDKVIHLSHDDLDGFSCQVLTEIAFKEKVECTNTSYGDVSKKIREILSVLRNVDKKILFMITDVNLKEEDCILIKDFLEETDHVNVVLLDHHATGAEEAEKYDWYHLDTNFSATKLTYIFLTEHLGNILEEVQYYKEIVNTYDLWLEENEEEHKLGSFFNEIVFEGPRFPKLLDKERGIYVRFMLTSFAKYSDLNDKDGRANTNHLEEEIYPIFKKTFLNKALGPKIAYDRSVSMRIKFNRLMYKYIKEMDFEVVEVAGIRFKVFWELDSGIFQTISHLFNNNQDGTFDACINVKKAGFVSARSKDESINVGKVAKNNFIEGGGHPCAAGGKISKEKINSYEEAIEILHNCN